MKILVVDDDEITRTSVKLHLENHELRGATGVANEITAVGTVSDARARLDQEIYDLAFIDIRLGPYHRTGGIELLRAHPSGASWNRGDHDDLGGGLRNRREVPSGRGR